MAHHAAKSAYQRLADRLNRFPQGAPPSRVLFSILKMLFSEREAGLVAQLPIRPFTPAVAAQRWGVPEPEARRTLEELASRAVLLDLEDDAGGQTYVLPPPMAGFFEFSMMRVRDDLDQRLLAELFTQYLNVEEDFVRELFLGGETQMGRAFVQERALPGGGGAGPTLRVLDHERASEVIRTATHRGVSMCYCRHKMQHMGRACDAPMDICMTFNASARSLVKHGHARAVDAQECLDLLAQAQDRRLVQFGENARRGVNFICNCCGCCCEAMVAARKFAFLHPVHTTRFLPRVEADKCGGCGNCAAVCPVEAVVVASANDPRQPRRRRARVDAERCLGCGVCVGECKPGALRLAQRGDRVITPATSVQRVVMMAVERGKLQNLIFDNQALASHRAMAAILGAILRLPPVKRSLADRQMRSRYLGRLLRRA
jgi:Pyruvate/2-oxoacid:ferredoxin oxidoreductase delta subunit